MLILTRKVGESVLIGDNIRVIIEQIGEKQARISIEAPSGPYENHSLVGFGQSVNVQDYYILRQGHDIITGLQCVRTHLTLEYMPGAGGLFLTKILPKIPILNKLLPNGNYRFLFLGNIYFREGFERQLFSLMEGLLARHQLTFGMIYMDKRSPVYQRLKSVGKFGIFNSLVDIPMHVMACLKGFVFGAKAISV